MATVYRAFDRQLERPVAVKLFAPGTATDDARRRAEATLLARLNHPNLVALFDAHLAAEGETTPSLLVMELVDGPDLRTRLQEGPLPAEDVAALASDIAEALVAVHAVDMVHRDLKPANILLAPSAIPGSPARAKLTDFGIAHLVGAERLTTVGTVIGTAAYLSPEQAAGMPPEASSDVYALGLVLLEALTGRQIYPGSPVEAVSARASRDPFIPPSLPEDWRGLLGAMTARDPSVRPTAMEVAVMARELAPQLAGWSPAPEDLGGVPTTELPTQRMTTLPTQRLTEPPTQPLTARYDRAAAAAVGAVLPAAAAARAVAAPGTPTGITGETERLHPGSGRRRTRVLAAAAVVAGVLAVIALAIGLGNMAAPAARDAPATPPSSTAPSTRAPAPVDSQAPASAPPAAPVAPAPQHPAGPGKHGDEHPPKEPKPHDGKP